MQVEEESNLLNLFKEELDSKENQNSDEDAPNDSTENATEKLNRKRERDNEEKEEEKEEGTEKGKKNVGLKEEMILTLQKKTNENIIIYSDTDGDNKEDDSNSSKSSDYQCNNFLEKNKVGEILDEILDVKDNLDVNFNGGNDF